MQLFLMRCADHDVAIDPRMLLEEAAAVQGRQAGLWIREDEEIVRPDVFIPIAEEAM